MGANLRLLSTLVAICIINRGFGASCSLSDIAVTQAKTGKIVEGKPEFEVLVRNNCECPQSKVIVKCFGLSSVELVDPHAIKPLDAEKCIVGDGRPIARGAPVRFKYAWLTPQDFPVVSSVVKC